MKPTPAQRCSCCSRSPAASAAFSCVFLHPSISVPAAHTGLLPAHLHSSCLEWTHSPKHPIYRPDIPPATPAHLCSCCSRSALSVAASAASSCSFLSASCTSAAMSFRKASYSSLGSFLGGSFSPRALASAALSWKKPAVSSAEVALGSTESCLCRWEPANTAG